MDLAPVALFVYNRPIHTQKAISSLLANPLSEQSDLYVFADAPQNNRAPEKVVEVRNYLKTISGFKSIDIIERKKNLGLANSIIDGMTHVVNKHEKVIVIEDDLLLSPYFLKFMNEALNLYQRDENVISIHGYIYPLKKTLPETFFLKGADCWGWATWRRGWNLFESDPKKLKNEIYKNKLETEFDLNGASRNIRMLERQTKGEIDSWAIRWHASAFLKNKYTLYPGRSLVQNIGMGKQSTHTKKTNVYDVELSSSPITVEKIEVKENEFVKEEIEKYFRSINSNMFKKITRLF